MTTHTAVPATPVVTVRRITHGPDLAGFLKGALLGSTEETTFTVESNLRGGASRNVQGVDIGVKVVEAECENGNGLAFMFTGKRKRTGRVLEGQRPVQWIEGYYDTQRKTGWIRPLN